MPLVLNEPACMGCGRPTSRGPCTCHSTPHDYFGASHDDVRNEAADYELMESTSIRVENADDDFYEAAAHPALRKNRSRAGEHEPMSAGSTIVSNVESVGGGLALRDMTYEASWDPSRGKLAMVTNAPAESGGGLNLREIDYSAMADPSLRPR